MLKMVLAWVLSVATVIAIMWLALSTRASRVSDVSIDVLLGVPTDEDPDPEVDEMIAGAYADYDRYRADAVMPGEGESAHGDR